MNILFEINPSANPSFDPISFPTLEPTVFPSSNPTWDPTQIPTVRNIYTITTVKYRAIAALIFNGFNVSIPFWDVIQQIFERIQQKEGYDRNLKKFKTSQIMKKLQPQKLPLKINRDEF